MPTLREVCIFFTLQEQDKSRYAEEKLKELQEKVDSNFKHVLLQKDQELQAEKETNEHLQDEMKLMEKQVCGFSI